MTHPTDEELDALVYFLRLAYDETKWTDHFRAGEAADAITALRAQLAEVQADLTFMTEDRNKWQDSATQRWFRIEEANARADRAEAALAAQIEAAIREIWGLCEELEDEAYAKLKLKLTEHEQGFWAAQKMTAKRIRRATQMPTNDRTALRAIGESSNESA